MQAQPRPGSIIARVQSYLNEGRSLTPVEAQTAFGTMRLASAIEELRNKYGMNIRTTMKANPVTGKEYASYSKRPEFKMRDRVQLVSVDASVADGLIDLNGALDGFYIGNYGRIIEETAHDNHVLVQFKNGEQWFVHADDLNYYRG